MDGRDDLQSLWQSGPSAAVPHFALLEDVAVTVQYPMSFWMRVSSAVGVLYPAWVVVRDRKWPETPLEYAFAAISIGAALTGLLALLLWRGRQPALPPDAAVAQYREALATEYRRQYAVQRRIWMPCLMLAWGGSIALHTSRAWRSAPGLDTFMPALLAILFLAWMWQYTRGTEERAVRRIHLGG